MNVVEGIIGYIVGNFVLCEVFGNFFKLFILVYRV